MNNLIKSITGINDEFLDFDREVKENISDFDGIKVINTIQTHIPKQQCSICGATMSNNGHTPGNFFLILDMAGFPCYLKVRKQKLICKNCHHTMVFPINGVSDHAKITNLVNLKIIAKLANTVSFKQIADDLHVSISHVIRQAEKMDEILSVNRDWLPSVISFDDFNAGNGTDDKMSILLINPINHRLIDVIKSRKNQYLKHYFYKFSRKARYQVRFVVVDLYQPYRKLIKELFPNAEIIADRFHIVAQAYRGLQKVRIRVMNSYGSGTREYRALKHYSRILMKKSAELSNSNYYSRANYRHAVLSDGEVVDRLLSLSDELEEAYDYYQQLITAIHTKNELLLRELLSQNINELPKEFHRVQRTLRNHKSEIISGFLHRYSNGPIEGKMNKIKVIKRIAYGFRNFNHFRIRILLCAKSTNIIFDDSSKTNRKPTIRQQFLKAA